ncbi:MAG: response regulator [Pseudohongiella sp.]|nr:response regulator [Pseudohongiella sp.]
MSKLERIIYIEDDPDIQDIVRFVLEDLAGFTVHFCSSGDTAVREAAAFGPDLILLDVMMAGMDGPTTLAALRTQPSLAKTPAVFMTAKAMPSEVTRLKTLGVLDVITKPFDAPNLAKRLQTLWDEREN